MSPTGVAVLFLLAWVVDWMSVGPNSIRDRLAFCLAVVSIREGFNGSPLDAWTVGALGGVIDKAKDMAGGAYIAGATTSVVLGAGVGCLAIYTVGALLPDKAAVKLGRFASIKLPTSPIYRINWRLWICAGLLGMLSDLAGGMVGDCLTWALDLLAGVVTVLPNYLFGVS